MHQQQNLFKLRADSMSVAHQWSCAAAVLVTMAFLLILISAAMPDFTTEIDGRPCDDLLESQRRGVFCNKVNFNAATVFQTYVMDIDAYSQTLYVKATPMKAYVSQPALVKTNITYQLMIDEVRDDLLVTRTFKRIDKAAAVVTCDFRNTSDQTCGEFMLFALPQIDPGNYRVSIQVQDMMEKGKLISSMKLQAFVVNPKYYAVFLGVRYTFFAISLTTAIFFLISYARIAAAKRVFEQHALAFMLVILALFNDPLAYLNVVKPSRFSVFVSIFCIAIFVTYVLFFWLVLFERVHRENGQQSCKTMQWWKIAYSAVFGVFFIAAMCIAGYLFLDDPTFYRASQSAAYNGTFAIAAIMVALAFIYLVLNGYFIVCAWSKLIQRNKLLFLYSAAFVVAMAGLLWGSAFNYYNSRGPTLLLAVVVCNLYTFLLVYVLLPLPQSSEEVMRYFRNAEINAGVNNQYGSLPQVTEEELFTFKPEEPLGRPKRLIGTDDKPGAGQRPQDDSNDYTLEDDDTDRKKHAGTSLQDKPTLSPQEPMSGSNVKQKDGDSFTFN